MKQCLHDLLSSSARKRPSDTAVVEADSGKKINYRDMEGLAGVLSGHLLRNGLKNGERVGILSRNSISSAAFIFAVSKAGGVAVPFNNTLGPGDICDLANDCKLSAVYLGKGFEDKRNFIKERVPTVRFFLGEDCAGMGRSGKTRRGAGGLAMIVYTSGTSGKPLGVMLSHKNILANNVSISKYLRLSPSDKICCVLPLYHIYGLSLLFSHIFIGGAVILENRFVYPNVVLDTIEKFGATGFAGVSSHYALLLNNSDFEKRPLKTLRYFAQAGDAMPPSVVKKVLTAFPEKRLYMMYGQTEAAPRLTYLDPALAGSKPNSVGRAIPGVKVKIFDKRGRECGAGEEGEIAAKGDNVMLGYWNNRRETAKVIKGGWLYTGDLAVRDTDGDICITGRKKSFVNIGGRRVNPTEIERLVLQDGRISEAAAIGVRDEVLGEKIKLYITRARGAMIVKKEISELCKRRLPSYMVPSEVEILTTMPKNGYGKIDRKELSEI